MDLPAISTHKICFSRGSNSNSKAQLAEQGAGRRPLGHPNTNASQHTWERHFSQKEDAAGLPGSGEEGEPRCKGSFQKHVCLHVG